MAIPKSALAAEVPNPLMVTRSVLPAVRLKSLRNKRSCCAFPAAGKCPADLQAAARACKVQGSIAVLGQDHRLGIGSQTAAGQGINQLGLNGKTQGAGNG